MDSIEYSWKYVTGDELLSHGECELIYAKLVSAADVGSAILYDGENANGEKIVELATSGLYTCELSPRCPVYCRRGLYVGTVTSVDGIFIQWRELP